MRRSMLDYKRQERSVERVTKRSNPIPHAHEPWLREELCRRASLMWITKMGSTAGGIAFFFWLYFLVMRHPLGVPAAVFVTPLDHWIPVTDVMLFPYCSLWVYLSLSLAILGSCREVQAFAISAGGMALLGLAIFWIFPTYAPPVPMDVDAHPLAHVFEGHRCTGERLSLPSCRFRCVLRMLNSPAAAAHVCAWILANHQSRMVRPDYLFDDRYQTACHSGCGRGTCVRSSNLESLPMCDSHWTPASTGRSAQA
jgi:hypothetical protein